VRDSPVPTETPEPCTVFDSEDQPIRVIDQIPKIRVHSGLLLPQTVLHSVENKGMGIAFTSNAGGGSGDPRKRDRQTEKALKK
jgi:hypothetical protein